MKCPHCNSTDVEYRGRVKEGKCMDTVWRKRRCMACAKTFFTIEVPTSENPPKELNTPYWLKDKI